MKKVLPLVLLTIVLFSFTSFLKTSLNVTVRDETGNVVAGASIKLFASQADYEKETNAVAEGTTDEKGIVKFKDLNYSTVFLLVRKGDKDNTGGGEQTKLESGRINKVTVIIQ